MCCLLIVTSFHVIFKRDQKAVIHALIHLLQGLNVVSHLNTTDKMRTHISETF